MIGVLTEKRCDPSARIASLLAVLAACFGVASMARAELAIASPSDDLARLMAGLSEQGVVRAVFTEKRWISLLTEPITTEGIVYFAPPQRLARYVTNPGRSRVVVDGTRVAFFDETGHRTMDLGSSAVAQALVGNFMMLLRGDLAALRANYEIEFGTTAGAWQLDLRPRSRLARELVARVTFRGRGLRLESMETRANNGDRSRSDLREVETDVALSQEELDRIFSLTPASSKES